MYSLEELPSGDYLVLLKESVSAGIIIDDLQADLEGESAKNVFIDGLIYYGNTGQRYMYLSWDGTVLEYHTFLDSSLVDIEVQEYSADFYREHYEECIEFSLLSDEEKSLVKLGEPL